MPDETLEITLRVTDASLTQELLAKPAGEVRETFALRAMQIGVLSIQQAQSRIDAEQVRNEGNRLVEQVGAQLQSHIEVVRRDVTDALALYFDPQSGRFEERIRRLLNRDDGELASTVQAVINSQEERLDGVLSRYVGPESYFARVSDPNSADGLAQTLRKNAAEQVNHQNEILMKQFSMDNPEGALARVVAELTAKHGDLGMMLADRITSVAEDFSLDREDSALSRLVARVDTAQKRIGEEFSLDVPHSSLSRMRREIMDVLTEQNRANEQFRTDMVSRLSEMQARRSEAQRSTRHGLEFEQSLYELLFSQSEQAGDVCTSTGQLAGRVRNSRRGDFVIKMGPEHVAAGERVVVEAKQDASYTLTKALADMKPARENRAAGVGIFVFSARTAPTSLSPFGRYDNDIVVVWNVEDQASDIYVEAALSVAKALLVRAQADVAESADFEAIERAILEITRQAEQLKEIQTAGETAEKAVARMRNRARIVQEGLDRPLADLRRNIASIRSPGSGRGRPASL